MTNRAKIKQLLAEEVGLFDSPLHKQLAAKADQEKIDYRKELDKIKNDHDEFLDVHSTVQERKELINRVSHGLNLSKRNASDFEDRLKALLDEYKM
jgi:hypothetical protein